MKIKSLKATATMVKYDEIMARAEVKLKDYEKQ
jgi:hypothetical protein